MVKSKLVQFKTFRDEKIEQLNKGKITPEEFHDYIYGYLVRTKLKPTMKPKNRDQAIQNYYYWTSYIERKIITEERLSHNNLGSTDQLNEILRIFIKRIEKSLIFLFVENEETPFKIESLSKKSIKITLNDGHELYSTFEFLSKIGLDLPIGKDTEVSKYKKLFVLSIESF